MPGALDVSYARLGLIVLAAVVLAGVLSWLTRRTVRLETLRRHHEVGITVFLQLGVVFAVLLAFVFNQVWSEYNSAAGAIQQECASLEAVVMMGESLPAPMGRQIADRVAAYARVVMAEEWPAMRRNERSQAATDRLVDIWRSVVHEAHGPDGGSSTRSQMLTMLARAQQMRETRLAEATTDVPPLLWIVLLTFALAMSATMFFFGVEYIWSQVAFTGVFVGCVVFSLLLVYALDQPFDGAVAIPPAGFVRLLATLSVAG